jgi:DNA polymerase delta subunit 1
MDKIVIPIQDNIFQKEFKFQVLEWMDRDECIDTDTETDSENEKNEQIDEYNIYAFGRTIEGYSVALKIINYTPFFHILLPDKWDIKYNTYLIQHIKKQVYKKYQNCILEKQCKIVKKKPLDYFRGDDSCTFLRLVFTNKKAFYIYSSVFKKGIKLPFYQNNKMFHPFETKLEPKLKFFHLRKIEPCNWILIKNYVSLEDTPFSICQLNYEVKWTNVFPHETYNQAPFLVMSFDIECRPDDGVSFPESNNPKDNIIQIGSTFHWYGKEQIEIAYKHIVTLDTCDKIEGVDVESYETEVELLMAWVKLIQNTNPDIHTGYNIFGFDYKYLFNRAKICGIPIEFSYLGKMLNEECILEELQLSSSALGINEMYVPKLAGVVIIDLYKSIMRDYKLENYKLDFVAEKYLGEKKNDVSPKEIFKLQKGNSNDRKIVAEYCIQDNLLCNYLIEKLSIILNNIAMANVSSVPLSYLFLRGQSIKSQSLIAKECLKEGYLMKTLQFDKTIDKNTSYEGAIVFTPKKSEIFLEPVITLDFASLYPSIMISLNICLSSYVKDPRYLNLINYDYEKVDFIDTDGSQKSHIFAKNKDTSMAILPKVVKKLLHERKETRKQAKIETNPWTKKILDGKQLGIKVSANSVYGALGASVSQIYCRPAAASITAMGRNFLLFSKKYAEDKFNATCVYGDSVTEDTIITYKKNNKITIDTIKNISKNNWVNYINSKMQSKCDSQVWTHEGWKPILRIIKHKTRKKIYRIHTNKGFIDVTEDHSLINSDMKIIKPVDSYLHNILINKIK